MLDIGACAGGLRDLFGAYIKIAAAHWDLGALDRLRIRVEAAFPHLSQGDKARCFDIGIDAQERDWRAKITEARRTLESRLSQAKDAITVLTSEIKTDCGLCLIVRIVGVALALAFLVAATKLPDYASIVMATAAAVFCILAFRRLTLWLLLISSAVVALFIGVRLSSYAGVGLFNLGVFWVIAALTIIFIVGVPLYSFLRLVGQVILRIWPRFGSVPDKTPIELTDPILAAIAIVSLAAPLALNPALLPALRPAATTTLNCENEQKRILKLLQSERTKRGDGGVSKYYGPPMPHCVEVFYATSRFYQKRSGDAANEIDASVGSFQSGGLVSPLTFGRATVIVPRFEPNETRSARWRMSWSESLQAVGNRMLNKKEPEFLWQRPIPAVTRMTAFGGNVDMADVARLMKESEIGSREEVAPNARKILLFIHGHDQTHEEAIRRAVELSVDLSLELEAAKNPNADGLQFLLGRPFAYSWPAELAGDLSSAGENFSDSIEKTKEAGDHLAVVLEGIVKEAAPDEINIVAHSLGVRVLLRAAQTYERHCPRMSACGKTRIRVVAAAAAVDDATFVDGLPALKTMLGPSPDSNISILASGHDDALFLGQMQLGGRWQVGQVAVFPPPHRNGERAFVALKPGEAQRDPQITTIDTTELTRGGAPADDLGHGYYAKGATAIADIGCALSATSAAPRRRNVFSVANGADAAWYQRIKGMSHIPERVVDPESACVPRPLRAYYKDESDRTKFNGVSPCERFEKSAGKSCLQDAITQICTPKPGRQARLSLEMKPSKAWPGETEATRFVEALSAFAGEEIERIRIVGRASESELREEGGHDLAARRVASALRFVTGKNSDGSPAGRAALAVPPGKIETTTETTRADETSNPAVQLDVVIASGAIPAECLETPTPR